MIRLKKAVRDLFQDRGRAILVLVALGVGGWGIASVTASTTVLRREVRGNFLATNPFHARLTLRGEGDAVAAAEAAPWVTLAERRTVLGARAQGGFDGRLPVVLMLVDDFEHQKIATFSLEEGRWPGPGEVALERDDLTVLGLDAPPEAMTLQLPGGDWTTIPVSGVVHDPGQAPARMEHVLYVYAPEATAEALGADLAERDVIVRMAKPAVKTRDLARGHAELLGRELGKSGFEVVGVRVPEPEVHPHQGQMETMLFVQLVFGGLAMLLSGVVLIHMMSSLLERHVAQVGVLKAVGGTPAQVGVQYLLMVLVLSAAALAVTLPLGFWTGLRYADGVVRQLNFDRLTHGVPAEGWLLVVAVSLLLPQVAAAVPVLRGVRVTVREALGGGGLGTNRLATTRALPIALRNVVRAPARTALTVLSLAVGLAALAASFHVGASLRRTMEVATETRPYDLALSFDGAVDRETVAAALAPLSSRIASWNGVAGTSAARVGEDGRVGDPFTVLEGDPLGRPPAQVIAGAWRLPPEGRAMVVTTRFAASQGLAVGDVVTLRIDGVDSRWPVGAVLRQLGGGATYLLSAEPLGLGGMRAMSATLVPPSVEELERLTQQPIHLRHGSRAPALTKAVAVYQAAAVDEVEAALEDAGVAVRAASTKAEIVAGLEDHVEVMTWVLAVASLVIVGVGGLGLLAAMSVSVLERTREIGVLRSLGAVPSQLAAIFAAEGAMIGVLSLAVGLAASFPLGRAVSDTFGTLMFRTPFDAATSTTGALWGAGVTAVLVAAVTVAALVQTLRQPTTAALRYE